MGAVAVLMPLLRTTSKEAQCTELADDRVVCALLLCIAAENKLEEQSKQVLDKVKKGKKITFVGGLYQKKNGPIPTMQGAYKMSLL